VANGVESGADVAVLLRGDATARIKPWDLPGASSPPARAAITLPRAPVCPRDSLCRGARAQATTRVF
jgi:hypothetical protein